MNDKCPVFGCGLDLVDGKCPVEGKAVLRVFSLLRSPFCDTYNDGVYDGDVNIVQAYAAHVRHEALEAAAEKDQKVQALVEAAKGIVAVDDACGPDADPNYHVCEADGVTPMDAIRQALNAYKENNNA